MQTNLESVKTVAETLALMPVGKTEFSPVVVSHPFTSTGFVAVRSGQGYEVLDILSSDKALERWQDSLREDIRAADSAFRIYMMLNKPYALTFLKYAQQFLSAEDFAAILSSAWVASENPHNDANVSKRELLNMFRTAKSKLLMSADDYKVFTGLPEIVTVYRGVTDFNAKQYRGLAWSMDPAVGEWFAGRFDSHGMVYRARISRQHIFAYFGCRNEAEIVLDPQFLREVQKYQEVGMVQ